MTGHIEIPYALGTKLWWHGTGQRRETMTCPECVGTLVVTIVLGNGETYGTNCRCCQSGIDPPRGIIDVDFIHHEPQEFVCKAVAAAREGFDYFNEAGSCVNVSELDETFEACEARCRELNETYASVTLEQRLHNRRRKAREDLAWSAHYWRGQRAKHVKDIAQIDERLRRIK